MSEFRLEFRNYNVGADKMLGPVGSGFAHNFLVLVEVRPDGTARRIAELHGEDDKGQLKVNVFDEKKRSQYYRDSENHPKFVLFRGSEQEARERFAWARKEGEWINDQNFRYRITGLNSNSAANTMARAAGFNVTSQPEDRTGRAPSLPAPSREIDLRDSAGRPRDADEIIWMERINGYGHQDGQPAAPHRQAPPFFYIKHIDRKSVV